MTRITNWIICGLVSLCSVSAFAGRTEILRLTDGSVLVGRVTVQDVNNGVVFNCENALLVLSQSEAQIDNSMSQSVDEMSTEWKNCFAALGESVPSRNVEFGSISLLKANDGEDKYGGLSSQLGKKISEAIILETGSSIKALYNKSRVFRIPWNLIAIKETEPSNPLNQNGIVDVLKLKSKVVLRGSIVSQVPGKNVSIILQNSNLKNNVDISDIADVSKEVYNKNVDIFIQSECLDSLELVDGTSVGPGLIISQSYEKSPYYIFRECSGQEHKILRKDVLRIFTIVNSNYDPNTDVAIAEGAILINGRDTVSVDTLSSASFEMFLADRSNFDVTLVGDSISDSGLTIEQKLNDGEMISEWKNAYMIRMMLIQEKNWINKQCGYVVDKNISVNSIIPPCGFSLSSNNILRISFRKPKPGQYMMVFPTVNRCITVWVK